MSTPGRHLKGPMPYFDVQLQMDALKLMPADCSSATSLRLMVSC